MKMAVENSNSTMEMGTSDQVLVASKQKKRNAYIAGGVVMVIIIALIVTAVVLLSGDIGGEADEIIGTTEGPTTIPPITEPTSPVTDPPTEATTESTEAPTEPTTEPPTETTTDAPETEPPVTEPITESPEDDNSIGLEDLNDGAFSPTTFTATWVSGTEFMYTDDDGNVVLQDAATGTSQIILANTSTVLQQATRSVQLSPDGSALVVASGAVSVYRHSFLARYSGVTLASGVEVSIGPVGVAEPYLQNFVWGPTGTSLAFVYYNNVYYKSSLTADAQQITDGGVLNVIYNGIPDWVYEEEVFGSAVATWFSPQGTSLAYATFNDTSVRVMHVPHYGVPGSVDHQYTTHDAIRYPKAGSVNPSVSLTIVTLSTNTPTTVEPPTTLDEPILLSAQFVSETTVAAVWANRVQNQAEVHLCTQGQATCTVIYTLSEPDGWIDNNPLKFNAAGTSFVTILPQTVEGSRWKQVVQVTAGAEGASWTAVNRSAANNTVTEILAWTDDDVIWYKATHPQDSAQQHLYSSSPAGVACFTCDIVHSSGSACLYNDALLSTDHTVATITCAGPAIPEVYLYNTTGERISVWEDNSVLSSFLDGLSVPAQTRLSVPVAAGLPDAQVLLQHPADVANLTNVPLLVYVYAGPDSAQVTHAWSIDWGSTLVSRWHIAVAHIDARGSGLRGVDNLFALNRRLGSAEIDDQIEVTRYLQNNLGYLDASRTCIWGWSYGGYAASLALARGGDVFRCAIAVAPVTDWRYYDTIYTERYMDVPAVNVEGYRNSSLLNIESAEALRNKSYFLVHGTADDNVHYQQAMLFSRLLQVNDVYFDQMSYTDEDHGLVGVRPHLYHALEHFLRENML